MAITLSLTEALQSVQKNMKDVAIVNDPENYGRLTGALDWEFSQSNGRSIQAEMIRTSGASKYRPVEIRYLPKKGNGNLITSDASATCTKTTTRREIVQTVNATLYVEDKFTIDEEIIREGTMEQLQARLQKEIVAAQRNAREDMDRQIFAALATANGANPAVGGAVGAYTTLDLLNSDGTVNPATFDDIKIHQEDNYMTGPIGIIGLGNFRKYNNLLKVGGLRQEGVDLDEVQAEFGMALYKDHYTTSVLGGANRVLAVYAGLTQFFNYNLYKGDFMNPDPLGGVRTTMADALYPFEWDFILKYDDECSTGNGLQGAWTGRVLSYFNLWSVPEQSFGELYTTNLTDFRGVVGYNIT